MTCPFEISALGKSAGDNKDDEQHGRGGEGTKSHSNDRHNIMLASRVDFMT